MRIIDKPLFTFFFMLFCITLNSQNNRNQSVNDFFSTVVDSVKTEPKLISSSSTNNSVLTYVYDNQILLVVNEFTFTEVYNFDLFKATVKRHKGESSVLKHIDSESDTVLNEFPTTTFKINMTDLKKLEDLITDLFSEWHDPSVNFYSLEKAIN